MTQLKPVIFAVVLVIAICSTVHAGNTPTRSGNIATRTGNIPTRSGNIATRTGNIPTRTGNIATRTGIIPTSFNSDSRFGFSENISRLIQLLLESGLY